MNERKNMLTVVDGETLMDIKLPPTKFCVETLLPQGISIQDEVRPIASRISKGLYRYAVICDMLCQIIAYQDTEWLPDELEFIRKQANVRMAKTCGNIDLKKLLDDNWSYINNMEDAE